jgi:hypothetical protein
MNKSGRMNHLNAPQLTIALCGASCIPKLVILTVWGFASIFQNRY